MVECFDLDPADNAYWIANNMEEKRYEYDVKPGDTIIDIGAYQGEWSRKMHEKYNCNSLMFEPVDILGEFKQNGWAAVFPAAWVYNGRLDFGGNGYWTSHYIAGVQTYECVDINKFLYIPIPVCKINIEGGEYYLLDHILAAGMQNNIKNFQIQFHRIENYKHYYIIIHEHLSRTHKKTWGVDFVWENWELK